MANEAYLDEMKQSALNFGLDAGWVADVIEKWGAQALSFVVEALRVGFTKEFVIEVLTKLGPAVLQWLLSLFHKSKMTGQPLQMSDLVVADEVHLNKDLGSIQDLVEKYLPTIIDKYGDKLVSMLLDKYGDKIVQFVMDWLIKLVSSKQIGLN